MPSPLLLGLDAGGSKTELLGSGGDDAPAIRLTGTAANVQRQGVDGAAGVLGALIREAASQQPHAPLAAVCAGVAGAGRAADREALAGALRRILGPLAPPHLVIVHDAEIALAAAFEGGSGLIVIAGTGSICFARAEDGRLLRGGGWGYLLGDEGSGYRLGLAALQALADAFDGGPATSLLARAAEELDISSSEDLIRRVYGEAWPVQQAAPIVLAEAEAGDAVARGLVDEQAGALARQVARLAERAAPVEPRIALLGGLTQAPFYRHALTKALTDRLPGWRVAPLRERPVVGALYLARAALQQA